MRHVFEHGVAKADRTGTGTRSVFGHQMRFDLREGFPLVTTKKVHLKSIILELLWFLRGDSNVRWLQERGVTIWDEWARADGDLGPGLRRAVAQLAHARRRPHRPDRQVVKQLKTNPDSRRIIVSAWNVAELPKMALLPCHAFFQFYVAGGPFGWAELPALPAQRRHLPRRALQHRQLRAADAHAGAAVRLEVGDFIWTGGDCHIYDNHVEQVRTQLAREPRPYPAAHQAPAGVDLRLRVRGLRGAGLPAPPGDQGAGGGLTRTSRTGRVRTSRNSGARATTRARASLTSAPSTGAAVPDPRRSAPAARLHGLRQVVKQRPRLQPSEAGVGDRHAGHQAGA
jgi:thymidylate synthase